LCPSKAVAMCSTAHLSSGCTAVNSSCTCAPCNQVKSTHRQSAAQCTTSNSGLLTGNLIAPQHVCLVSCKVCLSPLTSVNAATSASVVQASTGGCDPANLQDMQYEGEPYTEPRCHAGVAESTWRSGGTAQWPQQWLLQSTQKHCAY